MFLNRVSWIWEASGSEWYRMWTVVNAIGALPFIMWVGLIQSVEGLTRTKKTGFHKWKGILQMAASDFMSITGFLGSPLCKCGLASLHNCMSQFLIIILFIYIQPISSVLLFFLGNPNTDTNCYRKWISRLRRGLGLSYPSRNHLYVLGRVYECHSSAKLMCWNTQLHVQRACLWDINQHYLLYFS